MTSRGSSRTAVAARRNAPERSAGMPSTTGVFWRRPTTSISRAARLCSAACGWSIWSGPTSVRARPGRRTTLPAIRPVPSWPGGTLMPGSTASSSGSGPRRGSAGSKPLSRRRGSSAGEIGKGDALGNLGIAYANLGETRRAIELYEQDLAIAREIGDRHGEASATGNLGLAYADLGETRRAIELYEQHLAIAREIGDRRGEANATGNLGLAYADLGETRRAIELYEQHLAIAREIGDRRGEASTTGNLGIAYADLGETRRAIELYEQHLAIAREIGDRRGEANACWNLGLALEKLGELGRAAAMMQVRVDYLREIGHPDAEKHAAHVEALRGRMGARMPPRIEIRGYEWLSFGQRGPHPSDLALLCPAGTAIRSPGFQPGGGLARCTADPGAMDGRALARFRGIVSGIWTRSPSTNPPQILHKSATAPRLSFRPNLGDDKT